jgi:transcriptional regulator with XRE-family HTH domain
MPRKPDYDESLPGPSAHALSAAMKEVREKRGISVADAATAANITPGRLRSVENGRREPDFILIMRVARALGVRAPEFIHRAEQLPHSGEQADREA